MNITLKRVMQVYVFAYAFFFASRPLSDGDFWWHLRTGEFIVRNHSIPRTDPFSFSNFGKPWVAHEWLSDLIFYLVYSHFGFNTLIFVFAVLTARAFLIGLRALRRTCVCRSLRHTACHLKCSTTVGVRPRAFTLLLPVSTYLSSLDIRRVEKETAMVAGTCDGALGKPSRRLS
jgi:hypothetical protein